MPRVVATVLGLLLFTVHLNAVPPAGEYLDHLSTLGALTVAVARSMPAVEYDFKPDPPSMSFGEQFLHIATTNYSYCAGLKDTDPPPTPTPKDKDGIVELLSESFKYCSSVIANMTAAQLDQRHNSPDGRLLGREILLVFYVHVAHHRGQAEIYLRDKGIAPPQFQF